MEDLRGQNLKYASPLVEYLLEQPGQHTVTAPKGFAGRFSYLFKKDDLLMGVALHPNFKLPVVEAMNRDKAEAIRQRVLNELLELTHSGNGNDSGDAAQEEDYFEVSSVVRLWT